MMRFHDIVIGRHNYKNFVSQSKRQIQHPVPALLLRFLEASAGDKLGLSRFFQGILFRFISHLRMIKNQRRKYTQYGRDFYSLVVSIFMFHERNYVIKELQITYLNNKYVTRAYPCQVFAKQAEIFLHGERTLKHQQRIERTVPYPTKLCRTKVTKVFGGV